jgi:hypothetical protein
VGKILETDAVLPLGVSACQEPPVSYSTTYPVIELPPSLAGASHATVAEEEPLNEILKLIGKPGVLAVTETAVEAVDANELPLLFRALTRNR